MDSSLKYAAKSRQEAIVRLLQEQGRVSVRELSRDFGVSRMTVRRDLHQLEKQGILSLTYGGGTSTGMLQFMLSALPNYSPSPAKVAIGKLCAGLVKPGETIMVDSGTTTLETVRHLQLGAGITVVTVSLCVAQVLYGSGLEVFLLGGTVREDFPATSGPAAEKMLREFQLDTALMGCDAADSEKGFYTAHIENSNLTQPMFAAADRVIVVAESVKFGRKSLVRSATPRDISILVTDDGLRDEDRMNLERQGVQVLIAKTEC